MADDHDRRMAFALDIARRAGEVGLAYFRDLGSLTVESKGHQDLVSEADREVELFIRRAIAEAYPQDGVVGEEHPPTAGSTGYEWVIDPIDGTANFVRGIPAWAVVIACVRRGETVLGVIHAPCTGETYHAVRGGGACFNGKPMHASDATALSHGSVGVGFSNRSDTARVVALIEAIIEDGGVFFRNASGALMLAYVAAGRLIGYAEAHMHSWDCLAGLLMVEEAGGRILVTDPDMVVLRGAPVVASGSGLFDRLRAIAAETLGI